MLVAFSPILVYNFVAHLIQRVLDENTDFVNFINSFLKVNVLHKGLNSLLIYMRISMH